MNKNKKSIIPDRLVAAEKRIQGKYDAVDEKNAKHRRKATVEIKPEGKILGTMGRLKAINLGRNLERNYSPVKGHLRQFKLNVVGTGPKLSINTKGKTDAEKEAIQAAEKWFNSIYSKDCDSRDDTPLPELVANVLTSVKREGDILISFDNYDRDDGKLLFWEADQLVNVNKAEWEKQTDYLDPNTKKPYHQEDGILFDSKGRIFGYVAANKRGQVECKLEEVTVIPRGLGKLIKAPWRINQRRGIADILTPSAHYQDGYEMLASELQSAKLSAKFAMGIKKRDGIEGVLQAEGIDTESLIEATGGAETEVVKPNLYERFEALTGGYIEYLDDDDEVEPIDLNRPNVDVKEFVDYVNTSSGASLGLGKTYSTLAPASSYTAFRGDMIITWAQFIWDQKFLERRFMDWLVVKSLNWAISKNVLAALPALWEADISFTWPTMPIIDPWKWANAIKMSLKNGTTDFQKLLGPNWKDILSNFGDQLEFATSKKLPLSVFETVAGGSADTAQTAKEQRDTENEE